jgi:non-ribosomal peptide synthetase component F
MLRWAARLRGRSDAAVEELVGFFVNTLVLRTDTSGHPSVRELIGRVRSGNLAATAIRTCRLNVWLRILNPSRSLSRHPLFQVMLAHQPAEAGAFEFAGLEASVEAVSTSSAKFDLAVSVSERRGRNGGGLGIAGVIEYSSDLFDRDQIEVLGARLVRILEGAVADAERRCICCRSCRGRSGPPSWRSGTRRRRRCHLRRCRSCSRRRPSARPLRFAVVCEDRELSYAALEAHANQLAHHLRGLGVGPETVVGLCVVALGSRW